MTNNQNSNSYPHFVKCDAFNEAIKLKHNINVIILVFDNSTSFIEFPNIFSTLK